MPLLRSSNDGRRRESCSKEPSLLDWKPAGKASSQSLEMVLKHAERARNMMHSGAQILLALLMGGELLSKVCAEPQQVHISVVEDDPTSLQFFWMTDRRTDSSEVQYSPSSTVVSGTQQLLRSRVLKPDRRSQRRHSFRGYSSPFIHRVVVSGLEHDTAYSYRVGDYLDGYSPLYTFRTRPGDPDATVTFVWFGDQDTTRNTKSVLTAMAAHRSSYHFWLLVGDLSYADGNMEVWDTYGSLIEPTAASIPCLFSAGNHEDDGRGAGFSAYLARWRSGGAKGNEFWWSVDFGPMHLVQLSSEHDYRSGSEQIEWLRRDLARANLRLNRQLRPWIFISVHKPTHTSGAHGSEDRLREVLDTIMRQFRVQAVFSGHDHNYERILPIYREKVTDRSTGGLGNPYIYDVHNADGPGMDPVHVVAGTGGRETRPCRAKFWTASDGCIEAHGFNVVDINRKEMTMRFVDTRGITLDEWRMCLERDCGHEPLSPGLPLTDLSVAGKLDVRNSSPNLGYCNYQGCNGTAQGGEWCNTSARNCNDECLGSWCLGGVVLSEPGEKSNDDEEGEEGVVEVKGGVVLGEGVADGAEEQTGEDGVRMYCNYHGCNGWKEGGQWCNNAERNCVEGCLGWWCTGRTPVSVPEHQVAGEWGLTPAGAVPGGVAFRASSLDVSGMAVPEVEVLTEFQYSNPLSFQLSELARVDDLADASSGSTAAKASFVMTFPQLDYTRLENDPAALQTFVEDYRACVAAMAGVEPHQVAIISVSRGVLVDTLVTYLMRAGELEVEVEEVAESIAALEAALFAAAVPATAACFDEHYGPSGVAAESVVISFANPYITPQQNVWRPPLSGEEEQRQTGSNSGAVIGISSLGTALLFGGIVAAGIVLYKRRPARLREKECQAEQAEPSMWTEQGGQQWTQSSELTPLPPMFCAKA